MEAREILEWPLERIGLSKSYIQEVAVFIHGEKHSEWVPARKGRARVREGERLVEEYTIKDLVDAIRSARNPPRHRDGSSKYLFCHSGVARINIKTVASKLTHLGLTYDDWELIPIVKKSEFKLARLPKEELLREKALSLPGVTWGSARRAAIELKDLGYDLAPENLTVGDLLKIADAGSGTAKSLARLRILLRELDLTYDDGPLLQFGTRRKFREDLIRREGISKEEAVVVTRIAEKRGWAGPFQWEE